MKVTLCFTCLHSSVAQGCFNVCFTTFQHLLYFLCFFVIYRLERNKNSSLFVLMLSTSKWVMSKSYYVMVMVSYKSPHVQFSELLSPLKISWSSIKPYSYQGLFSEDLCYWSTTIKHMMWDSSDQKQMPTYMHTWYQIHIYIYTYHTFWSTFPLELVGWGIPSEKVFHSNADAGSERAPSMCFLSTKGRIEADWLKLELLHQIT